MNWPFALTGLCLAALACDGQFACGAAPSPKFERESVAAETTKAEFMERLSEALEKKGPGYHPRTRHLRPDGSPKYINRLIFESSPYLLQHAHNPVDWFAWGPLAFEKARKEGKPILLSVGYSTCHWCHVMERESFEDEAVAEYINGHYVAIKVDREERPDVDSTYMKAVQMMTGRGGWPMTVVMTPDKDPFFGGTYFPAQDGARGPRSRGLVSILRELRAAYDNDRAGLVARAQELSQRIEASAVTEPGLGQPDGALIAQATARAQAIFDEVWGGFGRAPKFPRPALPELLLRMHRRSGDAQLLKLVTTTLDHMAAGGVYDQVGGGFHRYSTDRIWLVPHFEKMLYDNAQLVPLYLEAFQVTGTARYAEVARETLAYVLREMTDPRGGFYSATDADSLGPDGEEEEGYYFSWTPAELRATLGPEQARIVSAYFGVTDAGNFEGRTILSRPRADAEVAQELGMTTGALASAIATTREALYAKRAERSAPLRDDKVLASWNGLMISAFARAALVLGEPDYAESATRAANFLLTAMRSETGHLRRSEKGGAVGGEGYLDDYAFVIQGLLDLFEATSDPRWLDQAVALQDTLDQGFWDTRGHGYFMTSDRHEALLVRDKPSYDGAEPSGNSVALMNLLRLSDLTEQERYRERATSGLAAFASDLGDSPSASPKMLAALEHSLDKVREVFIVLPQEGEGEGPLLERFRHTYLPNRIFAVARAGASLEALSARIPALAGKVPLDGRATAYVCEQGRCQLPTHDPEELTRQLLAER